jgi:hypothetical protein
MRILTAVFLCALATALPASAQDASGTWSATFNTPNGPRPATMTLRKAGEKLTGNISGDQGEVAIEGTQKGADVTFTFVIQTGNGPFNIAMSGKQDGDSLAGVVDFNGAGQGDWSAKRTTAGGQATPPGDKTAVDVSGPWALQVETGAGGGTPTVTFKQDGDKLTGQYVGQFGESTVTGAVKGSEITFSFDVNVQGSTVRVVYAGTVEKDTMKGTVTFGDLGEGTFTGKRK